MSSKSSKLLYRVATGVVTIIVLMFAANSIFNHEIFSQRFSALGHPTYIIYPLTIAKILGLIAIWSYWSKTLREWAYAGFFFVFILAMLAEMHAADGEFISSALALVSLAISYVARKRSTEDGSGSPIESR